MTEIWNLSNADKKMSGIYIPGMNDGCVTTFTVKEKTRISSV